MKRFLILAIALICLSSSMAMAADSISSPALAPDATVTSTNTTFKLAKGESLKFTNSSVSSVVYKGPLSSSMAEFLVEMPGKPDLGLRIGRNTTFTLGGVKWHMALNNGIVTLKRL